MATSASRSLAGFLGTVRITTVFFPIGSAAMGELFGQTGSLSFSPVLSCADQGHKPTPRETASEDVSVSLLVMRLATMSWRCSWW